MRNPFAYFQTCVGPPRCLSSSSMRRAGLRTPFAHPQPVWGRQVLISKLNEVGRPLHHAGRDYDFRERAYPADKKQEFCQGSLGTQHMLQGRVLVTLVRMLQREIAFELHKLIVAAPKRFHAQGPEQYCIASFAAAMVAMIFFKWTLAYEHFAGGYSSSPLKICAVVLLSRIGHKSEPEVALWYVRI